MLAATLRSSSHRGLPCTARSVNHTARLLHQQLALSSLSSSSTTATVLSSSSSSSSSSSWPPSFFASFSSAAAPSAALGASASGLPPSSALQPPRLPLPSLQQTCDRFLVAIAPLLSKEELAVTSAATKDLLSSSVGQELHERLGQIDKSGGYPYSYVEQFWDDMYLEGRYPIPINSNPFFLFKPDVAAAAASSLPSSLSSPSMSSSSASTSAAVGQPSSSSASGSAGSASSAAISTAAAAAAATGSAASASTHSGGANPGSASSASSANSSHSQITRAAAFTMSTLRFIRKQRTVGLEPDMNGNLPFCMSQYEKLFGTTRIPRQHRDELVTDPKSRHIIVMSRGQIYYMDVLSPNNAVISEQVLQSQLSHILDDSKKQAASALPFHGVEKDIGCLTTMQRNDWAAARTILESLHKNNKSTLSKIDSALFVLILDENAPSSLNEKSTELLHGRGSNRWFDKSMSLIVFADGSAGCNFEHAWGDGHTVLRYNHEMWCDMQKLTSGFSPLTVPSESYISGKTSFGRLEWVLNDRLASIIQTAQSDFAKFVANNDNKSLRFDRFGKNVPKRARMSPDGFLQMAMQLAYYRQHKMIPSTYESCNTKHFLRGRTETIRSASLESKAFVEQFDKSTIPSSTKEALLRTAIHSHVEQANRCKDGQGVDRHLFSLLNLARKVYGPKSSQIPRLFSDPGYLKFATVILSTSTLNGIFMEHAGFGAVSSHGYGVGYVAHEDVLSFNVASFVDSPHTDSDEFVKHLRQSLVDLGSLASSASSISR